MRSVVLLSGGLDSATCLAIAHDDGTEPYALTVLYGQRHLAEVIAAKRVAHGLVIVNDEDCHLLHSGHSRCRGKGPRLRRP